MMPWSTQISSSRVHLLPPSMKFPYHPRGFPVAKLFRLWLFRLQNIILAVFHCSNFHLRTVSNSSWIPRSRNGGIYCKELAQHRSNCYCISSQIQNAGCELYLINTLSRDVYHYEHPVHMIYRALKYCSVFGSWPVHLQYSCRQLFQ